jgi:hypothetical protein
VQIDVRLDEVVLRALETRPEMRFCHGGRVSHGDPTPDAAHDALVDSDRNTGQKTLVLPGAPIGNQPWRIFQPGLHLWRLRYVLPTPELARQAHAQLQPPGKLPADAGRSHAGTIFQLGSPEKPDYHALLHVSKVMTAADPRWVSVEGQRSWNDSATRATWTVRASSGGSIHLLHGDSQRNASLQRDTASKFHETTIVVEITKTGSDRVKVATTLGGGTVAAESTGDYRQLRDELLNTALNSAKSETGTRVELCRLEGKALMLEVPVIIDRPRTQTFPAEVITIYHSWSSLFIPLVVLALVAALLIRSQRHKGRSGCVTVLIVVLAIALLFVALAVIWHLSTVRQVESERSKTDQIATIKKAAISPRDSNEARFREKLIETQLELAQLSTQLGAKHPTILGLKAQIARLEEMIRRSQEEQALSPKEETTNPRIMTKAGTVQLSPRYKIELDVQVKGEQPTSTLPAVTLRGYIIHSAFDDGANAVQTFVPLAMDGEPYAAFWDTDTSKLWLSSPSTLHVHHLPEHGPQSKEMHFMPDIPPAIRYGIPRPMQQAMSQWWKVIAAKTEKEPQAPVPSEEPLTKLLETGPNSGTTSLYVNIRRIHYFGDDIADRSQKEAFVISAGSANATVFLDRSPNSETLCKRLEKMIPWESLEAFVVTLKWEYSNKVHWLNMQDLTTLADHSAATRKLMDDLKSRQSRKQR